jgi:protein-L-isoaspartate(D-aspartate) O-methyltransferase
MTGCAEMVSRLQGEGLLRSPRLAEAFAAVRREWFVPGVDLATVYDADAAVRTVVAADGSVVSSSSAPRVMAVMLERLELRTGDRVLEIGTGTGYNAALLAHVVGERGSVTTVDIDEAIVERAQGALHRVGFGWVRCQAADGWLGAADDAPFDRIIVTVGAADVAPSWIDQLDREGVLVVPLWLRRGLQVVAGLRSDGHDLAADELEPCGFMRLRGAHAGGERYRPCGVWNIAVDDGITDDDVHQIADMLDGPSATLDLPPLFRGWFTGLALSRSDVIQLTTYPRWAVGLYARTENALALATGDQHGPEPLGRVYGNIERAQQLVADMLSVPPVPLATLRLRVSRTRLGPDDDRTWTLRRGDYSLILTADSGPTSDDRPAVGWE